MIARNPDRRDKRLWSDQGDGEKSSATSPTTSTTRPRSSPARSTGWSTRARSATRDVAVFYRTNSQSRVFEDVFLRVGLPYKVVGGVRFYERREVRDALAYLRVLSNPEDTVSLRRILNVPKRGIGDKAEELVASCAERQRISFAAALRQAERIPGMATRSQRCIAAFVDILEGLEELVEGGAETAEILEAVTRAPATRPSWRPARIRRTGRGWTTWPSWSRSRASSRATRRWPTPGAGGRAGRGVPEPARWPRSWSGWRWSPTPTRSRTTTRAWSR